MKTSQKILTLLENSTRPFAYAWSVLVWAIKNRLSFRDAVDAEFKAMTDCMSLANQSHTERSQG